MSWYDGDVLNNVDFFGTLLDIEDFIAGLVNLGVTRTKSKQIGVFFYAFIGSIIGRALVGMDYGAGGVGMILKAAPARTQILIAALSQAGMQKIMINMTFMSAFEKSCVTQVVAKTIGSKIQAFSAMGLQGTPK